MTSLYSESIFVVETQLAFQPEHTYPFFPKPQPFRGFDRPVKPGLKGCSLFDVSFFWVWSCPLVSIQTMYDTLRPNDECIADGVFDYEITRALNPQLTLENPMVPGSLERMAPSSTTTAADPEAVEGQGQKWIANGITVFQQGL